MVEFSFRESSSQDIPPVFFLPLEITDKLDPFVTYPQRKYVQIGGRILNDPVISLYVLDQIIIETYDIVLAIDTT